MAEKKKSTQQKTLLTLDKRILDRNIAKGHISRSDVETYVAALPDLTPQADNIADKVWTDKAGA